MLRLLCTVLVTFVLLAVSNASATQGVDCEISNPRIARTFYAGEVPRLNIQANVAAQDVPYRVIDHYGYALLRGIINLSSDRTEVLQLPRVPVGLYHLELDFRGGETVRHTFCVIPAPNACAGSDRLWGWQTQWPGNIEDHAIILAQAGARYLRFDMSWPKLEPRRNVWRRGKLDHARRVLRENGLQMIPTLGYTPSWTAIEPDNMSVRSHTWYPDSVEHWAEYVTFLRDELVNETIQWPAKAVVADASGRVSEPLVRAWEIWNEVDQRFYFGHWTRYLDLLRIAFNTIEEHSHREKIVYGGACAHWTEYSLTHRYNSEAFFDQIAWHSGNYISETLPEYMLGVPQLGYRNKLNHTFIHTECYPKTVAGVSEADYVLRLYATLKAWRQLGYCYASIGGRVVGPSDPDSRALTYRDSSGEYVPNAKYVAYAATRYLLASASYVGPVGLGEDVTAYLFGRDGRTLLIMWAQQPTVVHVGLAPGAMRISAVGDRHPLRGNKATIRVGAAPVALLGVHSDYVIDALRRKFNLYMDTEMGFEYHRDSYYLGPLKNNCNWRHPGQTDRMLNTLETALGNMEGDPYNRVEELNAVMLDIRETMMNLIDEAVEHNAFYGRVAHGLWRLQKVANWIGEAADGLESREHRNDRTPDDSPVPFLDNCRAHVASDEQGTVHGYCESLLDLGYLDGRIFRRTRGHGVYLAAVTAGKAAKAFGPVEPQKLVKIFAVPHFPTANHMKKSILLQPGKQHTIKLQVFNFTDDNVSGDVTCTFPDTWSPSELSVSFSAPANGHTDRLPAEFSIPDEPKPWVTKTAGCPAGGYNVRLPETLNPNCSIVIGGSLSDGRNLLSSQMHIEVGEWVKNSD